MQCLQRFYFSKFLHGNNREIVCQNGKIPQNLLKMKIKVRVASEKLGMVGY